MSAEAQRDGGIRRHLSVLFNPSISSVLRIGNVLGVLPSTSDRWDTYIHTLVETCYSRADEEPTSRGRVHYFEIAACLNTLRTRVYSR